MKRTTIYTFAALALLLAATACTQDDAGMLPEASEGTPMTFTATGLTPATATRATVDGNWEGVTTVAIQIGNEVKAYRVTPSADNLTVTLSSDDPHYWTGGSSVTVSAWCPYTEGETSIPAVVVQADQSGDGYAKSDHIGVAEQQLDYDGGTPTLAFTHRTARIVVTVSGGCCPAKRDGGHGIHHHHHRRRQDLRLPDAGQCQMDGRQRIRVCDND